MLARITTRGLCSRAGEPQLRFLTRLRAEPGYRRWKPPALVANLCRPLRYERDTTLGSTGRCVPPTSGGPERSSTLVSLRLVRLRSAHTKLDEQGDLLHRSRLRTRALELDTPSISSAPKLRGAFYYASDIEAL